MSLLQLKRLAIALGVLIVAWTTIEIIRDEPGDGVTFLEMPAVSVGEVDSIVIDRPLDPVRLVRHGADVWSVNGYRGDTTAVRDFLEAFDEDLRAELVARNASSHGRFSIGEGEARGVRVYVGSDPRLDILVGKRGQNFQSIYLRWPNDDDVYVARSQIGTFVDRALNDWRDKSILDVPPDGIAEITVVRGADEYTLVRADSGQWNLNGTQADSAAVQRLLGQFSGLNATGFPTAMQMDSVDLQQPERRLVLRGAEREAIAELAFDSSATSGFWVQRSGDSTIFRLDRFRVDQLVPADSTLSSSI